MHTEFYKDEHILLSHQAVQSYEMPAYLQENMNHPEMDEHEDNRRKAIEKRRLERELAIKRKKLLLQLMDREKKIRDKIKEIEEELRNKLTDELRKKLQDEFDKKKKELEDIQKELDEELKRLAEERMKQDNKKEKRKADMEKIIKDKVRTGIRVKLEKLEGFRSKLIIKVIYGLFLNNEQLYDDLGEIIAYDTARYNVDPKEVKNKEGPLIKIEFTNEVKEFVKNIQGLLNLNKSRENRQISIGFRVIGIKPKEKKKIDNDIDDEDPLKGLDLPEKDDIIDLGWRFYNVASSGYELDDPKKKKNKGKSTTITMFKPPLLKVPHIEKNIEQTKIKLTFVYNTFIYDMDSLNYFAEQRLKKPQDKKDEVEKVKEKTYDKIYKDAFIKNLEPQFTDIAFTKGSGIDVYIDACRFLPDNVTVTKIIVRFINSELTDVLTIQGGRPELDSDIYNPIFNFRQELRMSNYDPTLMMCRHL